MLDALIQQLRDQQNLAPDQAAQALESLIDPQFPVPTKADFLTALARKGETIDEIRAFAGLLRDKAISPPIPASLRDREILDVCGTGGDRLDTFNISTTVAFVAAAAGIPVAKHGNRAVTSRSGSADVLEALGVRIDLSPERASQLLEREQFAFFFAPHYHPAFKHIAPARKLCAERGQRTVFNVLGPLLNPARPTAQLVGVSQPGLCETLGHVLQSLGVRRGMVVSGEVPVPADMLPAWLDELSTLGPSTLAEFYQDHAFHVSRITPDQFPCQPATLAALRGGDPPTNAALIEGILAGIDTGPRRDAVLLNAAAALLLGGVARSLAEGWDRAVELLESGRVQSKFETIRKTASAL